MSIAVARAAGTPRRMGRAQGEAMADGVASALRFYGQLAGGREDAMAVASTPYIDATRKVAPQLVEEMEGLAEGAGISFEEAAILNCMEEVWDFEACTSMSHGPFLLHAEQWYAGHDSIGVVVAEPDDGPPFVSPTCAGFLPAVGMNASGFAQGIDSLAAADDRVGVPRVAISRLALGAAGLDAAIAAATSDGRAGGYAHFLKSSDRSVVLRIQGEAGPRPGPARARPSLVTRGLRPAPGRPRRGTGVDLRPRRRRGRFRDGLRHGVRRHDRPDARLRRIAVSRTMDGVRRPHLRRPERACGVALWSTGA